MKEQAPIGVEALKLLRLAADSEADILHVTSGERRGEALVRFVASALPAREVMFFPPWDCLPYDSASPTPEVMGRRMSVLRRLARPGKGRTVVTALHAVLQRVPPPEAIKAFPIEVRRAVDTERLQEFCLSAGYEVDERIDEPGEVAFRGATIELFPAGSDMPCRIELSENMVEAIRSYDPATQRSTGELSVLEVVPVTELPPSELGKDRPRGAEHRLPEAYPKLVTLRDHMSEPLISASAAAMGARERAMARIVEAHDDNLRHGAGRGPQPLPPDRLYLDAAAWDELAEGLYVLPEEPWEPVPVFAAERRPRNRLAQFLADQSAKSRRVLVCAHSRAERDRVLRMVRQASGTSPETVADWAAVGAAPEGKMLALTADLDRGFVAPGDALAVITAPDLLGSRAEQPTELGPVAVPWQVQANGFALGDVVVHEDHGLARLDGAEALDGASPGAEAIRLVFANDQRLLVPSDDAGKIWRYGADEGGVTLDRLDTAGWQKRRAGIEKALAVLARQLADLAAERAKATTPKLVPPQRDYERSVSRFPHVTTPDQRTAIQATLEDMASGNPMNRLVIGDVGFGKTEVALRAAAAAAFSGAQVAIAAPTTVLARQHYETFRRRFAGLGIKVGHLSRLVTGKAAATVREGLSDGSIRIVVGTHALVGRNVRIPDLGLLVIDEEQRFGSAQKQKLRSLGQNVHVLSMSATPIPRTLQSALVGLQDLSVIATPPARRRPIRTLIADDDAATLRQALVRERRRGGQSFVVVPRVADIEPTAARLRDLLPQFDLRIAHGEMSARDIDAAMLGFAEGEGDILLATSIIESGLDVARANTMVIMRPSLFGLAQLHQLRGRVGRGALQAYCYLTTDDGEALSEEARKRLGTLQALDRLGAGMAISAADLDQRGAGDLLGDRQAGHVRRVGLGLYQELLAAALRQAKGERPAPPPAEFQGDTGFIPPDYIPEPEVRIDLYHRIARAARPEEVERLTEEVADRFGSPPPPVLALLGAASVRVLAGSLGIEHGSIGPEGVALSFREDVDVEREFARVIDRIEDLEWDGERLVLHSPSDDPEHRMEIARDLLERLT